MKHILMVAATACIVCGCDNKPYVPMGSQHVKSCKGITLEAKYPGNSYPYSRYLYSCDNGFSFEAGYFVTGAKISKTLKVSE